MTLPFVTPLTADQIAKAGVPGRWTAGYRDQVRFSEIDRLNHVNNIAYLRWFEVLRVRCFVDWGLTRYREDDPQIVLRAQTASYLAPMHMGDAYIVACRTTAYRTTSFTMDYVCHAGEVKVTGSSVLVLLEPDGRTKRPLPNDLVSIFRDRDGATSA